MISRFNLLLCILVLVASIGNGQNITLSKEFINIKGTEANTPSDLDTFVININSFTNNLRMVTTFPFELSSDGINFNDSVVISNTQSNVNIPIYIRTVPNQNEIAYRGSISLQDGIFSLNKKVYLLGTSILENKAISTCTWNVKWFGSPTYCGCDTALSRINATKLLKEIDADVIALQEVVSISQLQQMTSEMGAKYRYVIADYGSQISSSSAPGYPGTQKLAYIYNQQKLTNLGSYGLLRSTYPSQQGTSSPYYYFASGRWPYAISLKVKNSSDVFELFNMHAKAFEGSSEHNRRAGGALKMTDSLNAHFPNSKIIILGDYNDLLVGAISSGFTLSPYSYTMNNGFKGITLPSQFPGEATYLGSSSSLIDNYIVSNEAYPSYIPNATIILREADYSIYNFKNTTSDHLPVLSYFRTNTTTGIRKQTLERKFTLVQPNQEELIIQIPNQYRSQVALSVYSIDGKLVFKRKYDSQSKIIEHFNSLQKGIYIVHIQSKDYAETHKWLVD